MTDISELDTPAVLIDVKKVEANLTRAQAYADRQGMKLRPHIKTHKLPFFARRQLELGAIGITCQKLGEAEVMAEAGITDILIPYNLIGPQKLRRLRALGDRIDVSVTADNRPTVDGYSTAFADAPRPLPVLVECDTGGRRCGVQTAQEAVTLAQYIASRPGLRFAGLMTYPPRGSVPQTDCWLREARDALLGAGLPVERISNGGSPDLYQSHGVEVATEHRPGTYIYSDRMQVGFGLGTLEDCALTVLATVVSRPAPSRAILDAGSKALAADQCAAPGFGHIVEYPEAVITQLNEEHGIVDVNACARPPEIGERVSIIPNHVCVVSNLFDQVHLLHPNGTIETVPVAARGKLG